MCAGMPLAQHRGGGGLHGHHLHPGISALQVLAHPRQRAAGTHPGHEDVHPPLRVLPDLRACGGPVGGGVGRIHELARDEAARNLPGQFIGLLDGPCHALRPFGQHQLRAIGLHELAALHAHSVRHDDDDAVSSGGGHGGQADARIAGGGLDDDGAGPQEAFLLGIVYHGFGHPVLHGARRVQVFQLGQDPGLQPLLLLDVRQLQQGSPADQLVGGCIDFSHILVSCLVLPICRVG